MSTTSCLRIPGEELLLGPAYAIPKVLDAMNLTLNDIDVIELHEAFAGQVLSVLAALDSDTLAKESSEQRQKSRQDTNRKAEHAGWLTFFRASDLEPPVFGLLPPPPIA
ncbi:MAG: hypothetical protein U5K71_03295 [Gracilimonas sp.]|nr:hypothetical protein [Gracilimonas sp.]